MRIILQIGSDSMNMESNRLYTGNFFCKLTLLNVRYNNNSNKLMTNLMLF